MTSKQKMPIITLKNIFNKKFSKQSKPLFLSAIDYGFYRIIMIKKISDKNFFNFNNFKVIYSIL